MSTPFFDIPLNLPHAGTVADRICRLADQRAVHVRLDYLKLAATAGALEELLRPYRVTGDDPSDPAEAERVRQAAARLGRELVETIANHGLGDDRLGQCVRNLFECLAMGEEGALLSLRAGEDPRSLLRPS